MQNSPIKKTKCDTPVSENLAVSNNNIEDESLARKIEIETNVPILIILRN